MSDRPRIMKKGEVIKCSGKSKYMEKTLLMIAAFGFMPRLTSIILLIIEAKTLWKWMNNE